MQAELGSTDSKTIRIAAGTLFWIRMMMGHAIIMRILRVLGQEVPNGLRQGGRGMGRAYGGPAPDAVNVGLPQYSGAPPHELSQPGFLNWAGLSGLRLLAGSSFSSRYYIFHPGYVHILGWK